MKSVEVQNKYELGMEIFEREAFCIETLDQDGGYKARDRIADVEKASNSWHEAWPISRGRGGQYNGARLMHALHVAKEIRL